MRYQFLETKTVRGVEIAYVLDTQDGVVYRSKVEDFVSPEEDDYNYYESSPDIQPKKIPKQKIIKHVDNEEDNLPQKGRPPMIPAALAGVFLPADSPGAAVETRRT